MEMLFGLKRKIEKVEKVENAPTGGIGWVTERAYGRESGLDSRRRG